VLCSSCISKTWTCTLCTSRSYEALTESELFTLSEEEEESRLKNVRLMEDQIKKEFFNKFNRTMISVPGDGDCFLHACRISHPGIFKSVTREFICDKLIETDYLMEDFGDTYEGGLCWRDMLDGDEAPVYVNRMRNPATYVDEAFISATARIMGVDLHVYSTRSGWNEHKGSTGAEECSVILGCRDNVHFYGSAPAEKEGSVALTQADISEVLISECSDELIRTNADFLDRLVLDRASVHQIVTFASSQEGFAFSVMDYPGKEALRFDNLLKKDRQILSSIVSNSLTNKVKAEKLKALPEKNCCHCGTVHTTFTAYLLYVFVSLYSP
jgi:hypothetical protein